MFLKYNISNIKREKRFLNIASCEIDANDNMYFLNLTTKENHNLNIGDVIVFNRNIKNVNNYSEADFLLKQKKILFKSKFSLSLNDKVTMINKNNPNDTYKIIIKSQKNGTLHTYIGEIVDNPKYPKIYNNYIFIDDETQENITTYGWKIIKNDEIIYVLNEQTITENNIKKNYPSGYYWYVNNETILITNDIEKILSKYYAFNYKLKVQHNNFTENTFSISFNKYQDLKINNLIDFKDYGVISLIGYIPNYLRKGDIINLRRKKYCYKFEREKNEGEFFKEVDFNPSDYESYLGYERITFLNKVYLWQRVITEIPCEVINDNSFKYSYDDGIFYHDDIIEIEDNSLINGFEILNDNIQFYEYMETINLNLPISSNYDKDINDENVINTYFNEKKEELITNIVDYEKKCFIPYYYRNNTYGIVNKISFNLFFRERTSRPASLGALDADTRWVTNDGMGWFQYKINENGEFIKNQTITNGDLLGYLDFNDDDVYYQKKKLSKSFLRLSFYNNNDPLNQMLLFYSTIFLDTGDLYKKYVNNISKKNNFVPVDENDEYSLVNDDTLGENNLTVSFNLYDRFNKEKSSEGFYLYLFPDGLTENNERTIYMKAEFNHAGYGKTIPLILPNVNNTCLTFSNKNFPTSLVNVDDVNLKEFYRQLYIPLKIKYKSDTNEFIYSFNLVNKYENNGITLNLFEPKINPLI